MAAKGLGTPATRAAIIEGLIGEKYMVREGRDLIPTAKAFQLMTLLRGLGVEELTAPELTGEWEHKLAQMERGKLARDTFMQEIARMTQTIVKRAKEYDSRHDSRRLRNACNAVPELRRAGEGELSPLRRARSASSRFRRFPAAASSKSRKWRRCSREKTIGPLSGFRSKMGRPFSAILKLTFDDEIKNYKLEFDFGQESGGEDGEAPDFSGQEPVGACPKCRSRVFEHGMSYVCENSVAKPKTCDFRSGKVILQQEIARDQMEKLLEEGRTDLLTNFKSSRTGRNFKAYLVKQAGRQDRLRIRKEGAVGQDRVPKRRSSAAVRPRAAGESDVKRKRRRYRPGKRRPKLPAGRQKTERKRHQKSRPRKHRPRKRRSRSGA